MDIWNISSSSSSTSASFSSHHLASHSPHSVVLPSSISSTSASAFSSLNITVTAAAATMTNSTAVLAAALNSTTSGTTTKGTILMEEPPVEAWCFDLLLFYRSVGEDDPQAKNVLAELEAYAKFSFVVNGLVTCLLVIFGLLGNALFVAQLHGKSNHFSRRLANHLTALCVWDIALLCCCLCSYGVICMCVGILPFVGITAYLLYLFQPFASFCVTGTIWQVLAITVERYKAVSRPLEQRTRKGQFSLRVICGCIVAGAFALNFLAVPFERALVDCYEFRSEGFEVRTMIVQQELVNAQYYAILSHLIPDLLFRAPTPIIAIAILTVRTLGLASAQRTIGHQQIVPQRQRALGRNVHLMLTLLSVKFVLCNTLYLFNTILMEIMGYGGKTSSQQTELEMEQYIRSLYLTDFSNMLLAIHSATNWLIFYKWPKCTEEKKKRVAASFTLSASSSTDLNKSVPIDSQTAQVIFKRFREAKEEICANILVSLCSNSPSIVKALGLADGHQPEFINQKTFLHEGSQRNHCMLMADIIEAVISPLTKANYDGDAMLEWRDFCRQIGYHYCKVNAYLNADQWKLVRTQLIMALSRNSPHQQQQHSPSISSICQHNYPSKWQPQYKVHQAVLSYHQKALIRTFNCALREMKNGAIFALVDESQKRLGGSGYKALGALAGGTPIRLIKRMSWISGPPAGIVARAIFPRPSSSRDSFSLVFSSNETDQSCQNREEEEEENTEKSGIGCSSSRGISIIVPLHESAALLVGGGATKMTTGGGKMTTNELAVRRMTLLNSSERKPLAEIGHGEGGLHLFRS